MTRYQVICGVAVTGQTSCLNIATKSGQLRPRQPKRWSRERLLEWLWPCWWARWMSLLWACCLGNDLLVSPLIVIQIWCPQQEVHLCVLLSVDQLLSWSNLCFTAISSGPCVESVVKLWSSTCQGARRALRYNSFRFHLARIKQTGRRGSLSWSSWQKSVQARFVCIKWSVYSVALKWQIIVLCMNTQTKSHIFSVLCSNTE